MYPLAPVRRMSDFSGIAAGFTFDVSATTVSDVFTSDLPVTTWALGGRRDAPLPSLQLVLLHAFLDQITGCLVFFVVRLRSQRLLDGGHRIGILFSTHRD